jgi:hypothetical protein
VMADPAAPTEGSPKPEDLEALARTVDQMLGQ